MNQRISKRDIQNVKLWLASFILLAIAGILSVFCFLLEHLLWLYIVCGVILLAFVILYCKTTKAMTHKDGYTLAQAIWFYRACRKKGWDLKSGDPQQTESILQFAAANDFSKQLSLSKLTTMFNLGRRLSAQIFQGEA